MRTTGFALCSLLALGACGVGDEDPPSTPDDRLCNASLAITGTFTMSSPAPDVLNNDTNMPPGDGIPDFTGCWPTGLWVFSAAVTDSTCASGPVPETEYRFTTTYTQGADGQGGEYDYQLQSPSGLVAGQYRLKVSSGGGGLCEGVMELYLDGAKKAWYLHPALNVFNMSGPLDGVGDYGEYSAAIYP